MHLICMCLQNDLDWWFCFFRASWGFAKYRITLAFMTSESLIHICVHVCVCVCVYSCVCVCVCIYMGFPGGSEGKVYLEKAVQPTPVFLPGESHGQRSLAGYSPRGHKESDTTEWLTPLFSFFHVHTHTHTYMPAFETEFCICTHNI